MERRGRPGRSDDPSALRQAGQSAQERADEIFWRHPFRALLGRLLGVRTEETSWRQGARGEKKVGQRLSRLPAPWTVRHDLKFCAPSNIDHVVLGPPGLFAIDTKFWTGDVAGGRRRIFVNGQWTEAAQTAQWCARTVSQELNRLGERAWVDPVLVFIGGALRRSCDCNGVMVLNDRQLVPWLLHEPPKYSPAELARLRRTVAALR